MSRIFCLLKKIVIGTINKDYERLFKKKKKKEKSVNPKTYSQGAPHLSSKWPTKDKASSELPKLPFDDGN